MKRAAAALFIAISIAATSLSAVAFDRMIAVWRTGTLQSTTPVVVDMLGAPFPATVTLNSSAGGRLVEFSTDGNTWFTATADYSAAGQQIVFFGAAVSHVRITGTTNDTWSIR